MNTTLSLLPNKNTFVKSTEFNENSKIFTFAIGSNNNMLDWCKFLDGNINRALISNLSSGASKKYVNEKNINSFKKCLKFVDEG